ncbi:hypothetical protein [Pseudomonas allokribbensis]|uniref:hypothetical protein n=1 Tax=Pseudomonas allokribbensis TaxID=2774460 RepID=UPI001787A1F2|nr:hypothetical protein [Pseudomonas allokribbensis]
MTLIIAAYDYNNEPSFSRLNRDQKKDSPCGVFTISDSVITHPDSKGTKLATSFRKTYEIDINVYRPYFRPYGVLDGFHEIETTHKCLISIAGSTLIAQHALNLISTHLKNLRYVFNTEKRRYEIVRACEANPMLSQGYTEWDENMFSRNDLDNLLTSDLINKTVLFSVDHIIRSVAKDRLGDIRKIDTEFLLSCQCPSTKEYSIYKYKISYGGPNGIDIINSRIPNDDVGTIGMSNAFYERAKNVYLGCRLENISARPKLIEFMKSAIREVQAEGSFEIDFPIIVKPIGGRGPEKTIVYGQTDKAEDEDI